MLKNNYLMNTSLLHQNLDLSHLLAYKACSVTSVVSDSL